MDGIWISVHTIPLHSVCRVCMYSVRYDMDQILRSLWPKEIPSTNVLRPAFSSCFLVMLGLTTEEVFWTLGVTNVCVSAWLAGAFPYCYWVYHVFKFGLLLMLRCHKSLAVDHKLNIIEYCYLVNYLFFFVLHIEFEHTRLMGLMVLRHLLLPLPHPLHCMRRPFGTLRVGLSQLSCLP